MPGWSNYPTEWWHWSYGDRYWALTLGRSHAIFGPTRLTERRAEPSLTDDAARSQTTLSGSSCLPVGPIWMSVPISGQTPQS